MNVQNRPNIYTINDAAPPSYAEATGSASTPYNPYFEPHVTPSTNSSNCYRDTVPVQSSYLQYEPIHISPTERQNQPTTIPYSRPFIRGTNEDKCEKCYWKYFIRVTVTAIILACAIGIYLTIRKLSH